MADEKSRGARTSRRLGFWMCTALVVGNMIGSGVFLLPTSLAPYGWNAVFGWLLTIGGAICLAFVFARLSKAMPRGGGPYAYTLEAFGRAPAFAVAWSYWISLWVGNAAIAAAAVSYMSVFFPVIGQVAGLHAFLTCATVWLFTVINCRGVRLAGTVQVVTTLLKLLPLIAVMVLAAILLAKTGPSVLMPFQASAISPSAITAAATLTLWGMLGLESATVPADSVDDPERTIPRATLAGTIATGLIYLFVCSAVVLMVPTAMAANSNAPLADFVSLYWGTNARDLLALFAAISAFGALNGWILLQGELPAAMARDGVFPRWLAKSSAAGTPVRAHIISSLLLTAIVLLNFQKSMAQLFTFIILLATSASLVMYLACALAALWLVFKGKMTGTPLFLAASMVAVLFAVWTLIGAGAEASLWGGVLLLAGLPVYWLMRTRRG
jgi:basic amino acid/polyamine antiporter, APA family